MVLLFHRFSHTHKRTSPKMDHNTTYDELLRRFESDVLSSLYQISLQEPESYTLSWVLKCVRVLPSVDKAFAKLIADMDYEMSKWKSSIVEEYVEDNLSFLDELNCISSTVSNISQACMKLLHGLSLVEGSSSPIRLKNLKELLPWGCKKKEGEKGAEEEEEEEKDCTEKELIVHRALLVRRQVKNWVCRIVDSSIRGDGVELSTEMKRGCSEEYTSPLVSLQLSVCKEMKRNGVVREISEVNKGVVRLQAAAAAAADEEGQGNEQNELRERVEELGMLLEEIKGDVNRLFAESLARRNELLDCIRKQ